MRFLSFLLIAFLLIGCAASGGIHETSTSRASVDSTKSGGVKVTSQVANRESVTDALRQAINTQLLNKRVFASLPADSREASVLLDVTITEVSEVSQGARIFFGALAGQATINVSVKVIEQPSGATIGSLQATGKSSGGHVFAGTTSEALEQVASQIADYLLRHRKI